ncbi:MAG: gliding motility-associated protein GldE [Flavobacteriales bacterium]|nr:gliding motility-associated protein GldE [Flavobacteriales bacterium]
MDDPESLLHYLQIIGPLEFTDYLILCVLLILLTFSALVSGSEIAFFSLSPKDFQDLESENNQRSKYILKHLETSDTRNSLLATILIANNFINIAIVILSSFLMDKVFDFSSHRALGFIVEVAAITFLILLFGEVIPKVFAQQNALYMSKFMIRSMNLLVKWFRLFSKLLISMTSSIEKRIQKKELSITTEELSHALELTNEEHTTEDEKKILSEIVRFGNTEVKQVMTPRIDIVAIEKNETFSNVIQLILEKGFSRIPVYDNSLDQTEGILYIKDLIPHIEKTDRFNWYKLIRNPMFVTENKKIDDLLKEFQNKKTHAAMVVDEYGAVSGLISMEDIIEEIVGEITDEFDDDELSYSKLDDTNYIFQGKTSLIDVYKVLDIDKEAFEQSKGDAESLAGFILELTGRIPQKNEKIDFANCTFTIEAADKRRIKQIKLTLNS